MNKLIRTLFSLLTGFCLIGPVTGCQTTRSSVPKILAQTPFDPGGPGEVAANPRTGYVYITNTGNHVGVLKGMDQVAALRTEERRPDALAVDEERGWVYVVNEYSDSVTIIRQTEVITTLETAGREPMDVAVEPNSGWAYVVSPYQKEPPHGEIPVVAGNVTVISGTQTIGVISLGEVAARHIAADPLGGYVYVGGIIGDVDNLSGEVVVLQGMQIIARFEVGSVVKAIRANPHTGDVYALNDAIDRNLTQFRNGELIATLKIRSPDPTENSSFRNMKVHPVTGEVYVVDFVKHEVVVVRDMEIVGRAPVGLGALKMTIDPVTGYVYVANFRDGTVTVIDGTEVIATIETGWYPYGIGVNPATGRVYVSNTNGHTITVLGVE